MGLKRFSILMLALAPTAACDRAADLSMSAEDAPAMGLRAPSAVPDPVQSEPVERMLIRTGNARIEVQDLDDAVREIQEMASGVGGYVAGSALREGGEGARSGSVSLRIPAERFSQVVDELDRLGTVLSRSTQSEDVSREYFDLETRLAVKEEAVQRLQALLARSGDLEDLLAVERELARATAELESMKGQRNYFDRRVAMAELEVSLLEPRATIGPGVLEPISSALRNSVDVLAESVGVLIYVVVFLLPWALIALLSWPLLRRVRRRVGDERKRNAAHGR